MSNRVNETMTAAEYRRRTQGQQDLGLGEEKDAPDEVVAIDPGKESGLAWTDGERVATGTASFWPICDQKTPWAELLPIRRTAWTLAVRRQRMRIILEAPYRSAVGKRSHNQTAIAYSSGRVAREAELLRDRLTEQGYDVVEMDPSRLDGKWSSKTAGRIVGEWTGHDNEHTRDALRLLVSHGYI